MYVDTSVIVKLYIWEPDSEACEATVSGMSLVSSHLAHCEFRSAVLGKISRGALSAESGSNVWRRFEKELGSGEFRLVSLNDSIARDAAVLLDELHPDVPLRPLDALHLATYLGIDAGQLFTKDRRMRQAAAKLGLPLAG
jgi:predicted nucleic acid-binding protein